MKLFRTGKSHTHFQLEPKSTPVDDLEGSRTLLNHMRGCAILFVTYLYSFTFNLLILGSR